MVNQKARQKRAHMGKRDRPHKAQAAVDKALAGVAKEVAKTDVQAYCTTCAAWYWSPSQAEAHSH